MAHKLIILAALSLSSLGLARDVPANVRALYNSIVAQGQCSNKLATGFWSIDSGPNSKLLLLLLLPQPVGAKY